MAKIIPSGTIRVDHELIDLLVNIDPMISCNPCSLPINSLADSVPTVHWSWLSRKKTHITMAFTNFYEKLDQLCISLVTIHDEFLLDWFNMFLLVDVEFI